MPLIREGTHIHNAVSTSLSSVLIVFTRTQNLGNSSQTHTHTHKQKQKNPQALGCFSLCQNTFYRVRKGCSGLPWWRSGWESACQCRGHGFGPWSGRIPRAASGWAREPQLLSLRSTAHEPQLLSPRTTTIEARMPRARAPQQERPPQ